MDYRSEATYKNTRLPVDLASTLIADAYRDPRFFAEEQQRVFASGWVAVGVHSEVPEPGSVIVRTVAGRSVIVTRNREGDLRGFLNVCRHRASRLVAGDCTLPAGRIRCPYHAWAYDLDGACIGTPLFEGSPIPEDMQPAFDMTDVKAFDRADYSLFPVEVDTVGPLILVSIDSTVTPLDMWVGDLADRLAGYALDAWQVQARRDYDIGANWKLIAENFMEYYHLPWVHPELAKVSRIQDHYRYQGPGMYTGMTTTPISGGDSAAWLALPAHEGVAGADRIAGRFMLLFPNATLSVLPNHAFVMVLEPVAPDRTLERTYLLTHPDTIGGHGADAALETLLDFWNDVNVEDIEIVESVQHGISTPEYEAGRMCYRFEEPVHRFQNMLIDRMVGVRRIPPGDAEETVPMFGG
jgi:choline monooxygenase